MTNLPLLLSVLKRRAIPATLTVLSAALAGVVHAMSLQPTYSTSARLAISEQTFNVSELGQAISEVQSSSPSGANLLATQSELIRSEQVLQRALERLPPDISGGENPLTVPEMKSSLSIKVLPATNIIELAYTYSEPERAATILNEIAEAALAVGAESIRLEATAVRSFLEEELPQQEARLKAAEEAESQYRLATGIVALDVQTENLVGRLAAVRDQELDLTTQLQEAHVRNTRLQEVTGINTLGRAYASVRIGQSQEVNQLETQLLEIESAVIEAQSRLGPQHPDLLALLEQREDLRNLYQQELAEVVPDAPSEPARQAASDEISQNLISEYILQSIELSSLEESLNTIQANRVQLESDLAQIPRYQQPLASLVREREEAAQALTLLRNKLEEARIAEAQIVNNIRLIDAANVPTAPSNTPSASLVIAAAAGLLLALCVVLLLEAIDDRVHDSEELEAIVDLPVLGVLPKNLPSTPDPGSIKAFLRVIQWTEPYRLLLKTLEFHSQANDSNQTNLFVISGLEEYEGQSLCAANLVAVAAQMCRQTLLIDANRYQPLQHRFFGVRLHPGLDQTLERSGSELQELHSGVLPNLDVLPYGGIDAKGLEKNASETPEMRRLLATASEQYDYVAIAAPALATCADAIALSSHGASLVIVVQANVTSKSLLKRTLSNLEKAGTSVLGIVMAQTTDPEHPYQSYPKVDAHGSYPASSEPEFSPMQSENGYRPTLSALPVEDKQ